MASTVITPIADAIADVLTGLAVTPTVKGRTWDPGLTGIDKVPCGIVGPPELRRTALDDSETQLGALDWYLDYPVIIGVDLDVAPSSASQLVEIVEAFVKAIDADQTLGLGAFCDQAIVSEFFGPERSDPESGRPLYFYAGTVTVRALVF